MCLCVFVQNHVNPAVDFTQIPPGMLALDNMLYFARQHQDAYIRVRLARTPTEMRCGNGNPLVFIYNLTRAQLTPLEAKNDFTTANQIYESHTFT